MGILRDKLEEARKLNQELEKTQGLLGLGAVRGPRGANAGDIRGLGGKLDVLGRKIDRLGGGKADPFMADLFRGSGPRGA